MSKLALGVQGKHPMMRPSRMERTLVPMMKVTKKAMKVVMVGRTAKARKKKPRRRKRKRRVVRAAHEQKRRRQSPSRRTRRPRRVLALEEPTVDVDAVLSIYISTALIPTDPRGVCGCILIRCLVRLWKPHV
jgi:hypothetical protein